MAAQPRRIDPTYVRAQIDMLRAANPELWDAGDEQLLSDMLEAETDLVELLSKLTMHMLEAEHFALGIEALIASLEARRDRYNGRRQATRELMFRLMSWADTRKLELPQATLSVRPGQPKVIITDQTALPETCIRVKREPDKATIKTFIDSGKEVPGAALSNAEPYLAVRIK